VNASAFPSALLTTSATSPVVTRGTLSGVSPPGWPRPSMLDWNRCDVQALGEVTAAATNVRSPPSLLTATKSGYGLGGWMDATTRPVADRYTFTAAPVIPAKNFGAPPARPAGALLRALGCGRVSRWLPGS